MRVIIDTNVLISGIFFDGPPAKILMAWQGGELQLVISPEILQEYYEVCERISVRYPDIDIAPILVLIARNSQVVESPPLADQVSRDTEDDKFIACAIASDTRRIISGDNDLLTVAPDTMTHNSLGAIVTPAGRRRYALASKTLLSRVLSNRHGRLGQTPRIDPYSIL